jgi:hypothetical protein
MPDFGVHHADLTVHDAPISVFTIPRFECSRWAEIRTSMGALRERGSKSVVLVRPGQPRTDKAHSSINRNEWFLFLLVQPS